jgi:L-ascorbate metabolism protein UlaG (beta-lactamase superfamily)
MKARLLRLWVAVILFIYAGLASAAETTQEMPEEAKKLLKGVTWFAQGAVRIEAEKTIYVDPYRLTAVKKDADIILITHSHGDHLSPADIAKIAKPDTVFVCPRDPKCQAALKGKSVKTVAPGEKVEVSGVKIAAVPAYNSEKLYHRKSQGWVGYVVQIGERSFYFAGDTDAIPEMKEIEADVAFLPVGDKYTMDSAEAAEAAKMIRAKYFVPYHCGGAVIGSKEDFQAFRAACPKAVIMEAASAK